MLKCGVGDSWATRLSSKGVTARKCLSLHLKRCQHGGCHCKPNIPISVSIAASCSISLSLFFFFSCFQSDCESDEELFIFQRDLPDLIPDLSEELMMFSLEDSQEQVGTVVCGLFCHPSLLALPSVGS